MFTACTSNKYNDVKKINDSGNYFLAIEEYDKMLSAEQNGYLITLAVNDRSEAYYKLGLNALERNNTNLAIRLFLLSNTDKADEKIIEAYEKRIELFDETNQTKSIMPVYNYIITNLYRSPRIPELIYKRIALYHEMKNHEEIIWKEFMKLHDDFPDNEYILLASQIVDTFLRNDIEKIFNKKETADNHEELVDQLKIIKAYPTTHETLISEKIADIYIYAAEKNIREKKYISAEQNFRKALIYDKNEEEYINKRLRVICEFFIKEGESLLAQKRINEAIEIFNRSFQIIPDYALAKNAIFKAEQKRADIRKAEELYNQGQQLFRNKKYQEALELYRQANQVDKTELYQKNIFEVENLIEIEKDPQSFALKVIREHQNGRITKAVESLQGKLSEQWGKELRDSGWKAVRSVGTHRMEIRYDLLTPETNYYLAWQINMREKQIIPLNKATENLMEN